MLLCLFQTVKTFPDSPVFVFCSSQKMIFTFKCNRDLLSSSEDVRTRTNYCVTLPRDSFKDTGSLSRQDISQSQFDLDWSTKSFLMWPLWKKKCLWHFDCNWRLRRCYEEDGFPISKPITLAQFQRGGDVEGGSVKTGVSWILLASIKCVIGGQNWRKKNEMNEGQKK